MDRPQGVTGEACKEDGTYTCRCGCDSRYYAVGDRFLHCPSSGKPTTWFRST